MLKKCLSNKLVVVLAVIMMLGIVGCESREKKEEHGHGESEHGEHAEHEGEHGHDEHDVKNSIEVNHESKELIGVELTKATYRAMEETLMVTGNISQDTESMYHISPKTSGEVVEVNVKYGDIVKEGQNLSVIRSAMTGYITNITSPINGMIIGENITKGAQVDSITSIFTVADLRTMWANFNIYEKDIGKVKVGQRIRVNSIAYPDKYFSGKIVFISPRVDEKTRTVKVRANIENKKYLLKLNMFVTGQIIISNKNRYLAVPSTAIQMSGEKEIVFVPGILNEFTSREVKIGFQFNGFSQVIEGLKEGEKVVVKGGFLLKSELLKSELGAGCAD